MHAVFDALPVFVGVKLVVVVDDEKDILHLPLGETFGDKNFVVLIWCGYSKNQKNNRLGLLKGLQKKFIAIEKTVSGRIDKLHYAANYIAGFHGVAFDKRVYQRVLAGFKFSK